MLELEYRDNCIQSLSKKLKTKELNMNNYWSNEPQDEPVIDWYLDYIVLNMY